MYKFVESLLVIFLLLGPMFPSFSQAYSEENFKGLKFRNVGPAFTSGRIADIAFHPDHENTWYVAVGSGGVWKTINAGTTWTPVFDKETSYSIGCIALDPDNPHTVWVGTGENVGGRHVGFGDGIYVSHNDGATWENMGLKSSEHISKIIVHPENSQVIWVAAQGPLWSSGGERGVYKSNDGGKTWNQTLGNNVWTGATDLLIDPANPDILYAALWQRHRTVAAYLGGGPGSGIYKSFDGGQTWQALKEGIPDSNLGKIGLALSPFNPEVIYAAIELDRKKGGVFISKNGGLSWEKQSEAVSGGTGPHYYQELYASPHQEGKLFLMSNTVQISDDHGKTFYDMNEENKHVDSHAMAFKKDDPNYLMFGTDGGLYETFDLTKSWRFIRNLPITQYYKVAVDDAEPFYNLFGGTQDNGSHGGPSRSMNEAGISNADWWVTLFADGHQSATEPGNPDITYGEYQQGVLWRIDQTTGETVLVQPQEREGDPFERFNWDAPILVSPHKPARIYVASQRVWRSENRGDEWTPISGDLTRNENRITLPVMGQQQSWDNGWDIAAMSNYNSITSLAESPMQEGLLYAGTDDGIIQVSENGGQDWRKIELGTVNGLPSRPFVNDVRADLFDANTVYAALDNHKYGDFKPYLLKSVDKGRSWALMNGDLPNNKLLTWRIVQDHISKDLLFIATEFGIYFTHNGGKNWIKLGGGTPTISFRDLTIHRRENDLVAASFGRGFFILDDITPIRDFDNSVYNAEATLFDVKDAYRYIEKDALYGQGDAEYYGENPPYGAVFSYYLKDKLKSQKELRQEKEKELIKNNQEIKFPGWETISSETTQESPEILLTVHDSDGLLTNSITGTNEKGFNRVNWRLNYPVKSGERLIPPSGDEGSNGSSIQVLPGDYTVTLSKRVDGVVTQLAGPVNFKVKNLLKGALEGIENEKVKGFREEFIAFQQDLTATNLALEKSLALVEAMKRAADKSNNPVSQLFKRIYDVKFQLLGIETAMRGDKAKNEIGERSDPTPSDGIQIGRIALSSSTYGPTANHIMAVNRAVKQLAGIKAELKTITESTIPGIEKDLQSAGAPWIEGQGIISQE